MGEYEVGEYEVGEYEPPASVSMGEPQLPTWMVFASAVRDAIGIASGQWLTSELKAMASVDPSCRDSAAKRPLISRGNNARPLFWAAGPWSGELLNDEKSVVSSSCIVMSCPTCRLIDCWAERHVVNGD